MRDGDPTRLTGISINRENPELFHVLLHPVNENPPEQGGFRGFDDQSAAAARSEAGGADKARPGGEMTVQKHGTILQGVLREHKRKSLDGDYHDFSRCWVAPFLTDTRAEKRRAERRVV